MIFASIVLVYVIFDLFYFFESLKFKSEKVEGLSATTPCLDLTVQIPIFNSKEKMEPMLQSLAALPLSVCVQVLDSSDDAVTTQRVIDVLDLEISSETDDYQLFERGQFSMIHFKVKHGNKGWALNFGLSFVKSAFIAVFDGDWPIKMDQLSPLLNELLQNPSLVFAQASWESSNEQSAAMAYLDAVSIEAEHRIEDEVRTAHASPITIHGSAFVIRTDSMKGMLWRDEFLSEDVDLTLRLLLNGERGVYVPWVRSQGLTCTSFSEFHHQKMRWCEGRSQMARIHLPALLKSNLLSMREKAFVAHFLLYFFRYPALFFLACEEGILKGRFYWTLACGLLMVASKTLLNCRVVFRKVDRRYGYALLEPMAFLIQTPWLVVRVFRGLITLNKEWKHVQS